MVHPWVLSRSLFDSKRARSARKELREIVTEARVTTPSEMPTAESPSARRWIRRGTIDFLLVPPLAFAAWNVIDILMGN
ncbi:hypothetical protein [Streptomyces sp. NPDC059575]|uniref:hypothetical protein n=1 Tax=Streptomyces sp. NPDC059575 TaxID=3346872 RepID=UPI0036960C91